MVVKHKMLSLNKKNFTKRLKWFLCLKIKVLNPNLMFAVPIYLKKFILVCPTRGKKCVLWVKMCIRWEPFSMWSTCIFDTILSWRSIRWCSIQTRRNCSCTWSHKLCPHWKGQKLQCLIYRLMIPFYCKIISHVFQYYATAHDFYGISFKISQNTHTTFSAKLNTNLIFSVLIHNEIYNRSWGLVIGSSLKILN